MKTHPGVELVIFQQPLLMFPSTYTGMSKAVQMKEQRKKNSSSTLCRSLVTMVWNSTTAESDNNDNQYGSGSLDQYNWFDARANRMLIVAINPEIVGDNVPNCHVKKETISPVIPPHKPDFQKRRIPRCA